MLKSKIIKMRKLADKLHDLTADFPTPRSGLQNEILVKMTNPSVVEEKQDLGHIKSIIHDLKSALDQYKAG